MCISEKCKLQWPFPNTDDDTSTSHASEGVAQKPFPKNVAEQLQLSLEPLNVERRVGVKKGCDVVVRF